jgi:uncharacterized protein (DUF362 family)/Pyruvate/2-oxoacid:ferredoxin oxidoreductase delta subunit
MIAHMGFKEPINETRPSVTFIDQKRVWKNGDNQTEKVAIVKIESNDYNGAFRKAMSLLGNSLKFPIGKPVILKPNFVAPRKGTTGAITDFELIKTISEVVRESGACPAILETPGMEYLPEDVYNFLEIEDFAKKFNIALYSGRENLIKLTIAGGKTLHSIKIAKILTEAPIINIPKFKAHPLTKLSFGMKNLMGALPPRERTNMHVHGIHQSIVDINRVIKPILTIVDANNAMEGDSVYGDRIDLGLLIVGANTLAVDIACCRIAGSKPEDISHIRFAMKEFGISDVEVVGDVHAMNSSFKLPQKGTLYELASRLMYIADVPFRPVFGIPFNRFLYRSGFFGTRPQIDKQKCISCGKCADICSVKGTITLEPPRIDYGKCVRCLECVSVCPEKAINVKGLTKPSKQV